MGYATLMCHCAACKKPLMCNPAKVPSIRVQGEREPICESCFNKWNRIHRIEQGLPAIPLDPEAYGACHDSELG